VDIVRRLLARDEHASILNHWRRRPTPSESCEGWTLRAPDRGRSRAAGQPMSSSLSTHAWCSMSLGARRPDQGFCCRMKRSDRAFRVESGGQQAGGAGYWRAYRLARRQPGAVERDGSILSLRAPPGSRGHVCRRGRECRSVQRLPGPESATPALVRFYAFEANRTLPAGSGKALAPARSPCTTWRFRIASEMLTFVDGTTSLTFGVADGRGFAASRTGCSSRRAGVSTPWASRATRWF